ncbi:hypothetical protein [Roseobacter sinensis]|uniref:Uncharacterized protein n=1 Tax=Roseobacter sinensis TaxID=2931391 RepID=A0ABT3BAU5_9RHOB|nr:hypothetical protein [Roseobacter sp. WL0113]MCV3270703.1 hypothetical protein [Roseobacter sp. WL0113]
MIRSPGPGALYNIGNLLALVSGAVMPLVHLRVDMGVGAALAAHFAGSPGALWLSGAMGLFLVSGVFYDRAWRDAAQPQPRLVQLGDLLAGIAAIMLTVALVWLGDTALALLAGVLLAGGKLGTAVLPTVSVPGQTLLDRGFRMAVIISRGPSIAALALTLSDSNGTLSEIALPTMMIFCFLLWFWADLLLLKAGPVQLIEPLR